MRWASGHLFKEIRGLGLVEPMVDAGEGSSGDGGWPRRLQRVDPPLGRLGSA